MSALNPFRFRALCAVSTATITTGLVLPPAGLTALAGCWIAYVLLYAAVSITRDGVRGLAAPTLVIGAMGVFHWKVLLPLLVNSWLVCVLYLLALTALRAIWRGIKRWFGRRRAKRQVEELRPVRIAVPVPKVAVDARVILRQFGFRAS
jgi:hypothetical protein